jgi:hypothetical protein
MASGGAKTAAVTMAWDYAAMARINGDIVPLHHSRPS